MLSHKTLTRAIHQQSTAQTVGVCVIALLFLFHYASVANSWSITEPYKIFDGAISFGVALLPALILQLNIKEYNLLRHDSAIVITMYMLMLLTLPAVTCALTNGMIACIALLGGSSILFTTYEAPGRRRRIFLLLTATTAVGIYITQLIYYLPFLMIGAYQMRIFSLKTLLAILLGMATPLWIVLGLGILTPDDLLHSKTPGLSLETLNPQTITVYIVSALILLLGIGFICANMMKVVAFNARTRSFNGYYTLLMLATVALMAVDASHIIIYIPTLIAMTAYQTGLFFATHQGEKTWIGALTLALISLLLYAWSMSYTLFI